MQKLLEREANVYSNVTGRDENPVYDVFTGGRIPS